MSHALGGLAAALGRYDDAGAYFAQAAELCERLGMQFFATENDLAWGTMLAEHGDTAIARQLLLRAQASAAAHGYARLERRATEALQRVD